MSLARCAAMLAALMVVPVAFAAEPEVAPPHQSFTIESELLHETRVRPARMLMAVMATLDLPGTRLVEQPSHVDTMAGAIDHAPDERQVGWFEDAVRDSVRLRRELGGLP